MLSVKYPAEKTLCKKLGRSVVCVFMMYMHMCTRVQEKGRKNEKETEMS